MVMYGYSFLVSNVVHVGHVVNRTHSNGLRALPTWAKRGPCVVHRLQLRNWTGYGPRVLQLKIPVYQCLPGWTTWTT